MITKQVILVLNSIRKTIIGMQGLPTKEFRFIWVALIPLKKPSKPELMLKSVRGLLTQLILINFNIHHFCRYLRLIKVILPQAHCYVGLQ